jgi:tetratricopeptide (TPR) repeat protein
MLHVLLSLVFLALVGCADLQTRLAEPPSKPLTSAAEAVNAADVMAKEGRWSRALALLEKAARDYPGDPEIEARRVSMRERWERQERLLEDQIMVGDAENQERKIALLEKLSLAEPGNLLATSRRIYWKEILASNVEKLTACGEFHVTTETSLARRCFQLASGMVATPEIEQRLAGISEQLLLTENIAAERRRAEEAKERQQRAKVLLDDARATIDARDYRRALDILEKVAELQPNNSEVSGLQEEAWAMISPQVEALVKLGDHLYLDEQLDAAVATWQAALTLKPEDEAILARIDRAKTVLNRLDALRRQQNPSTEDQ